MQNSNFSYQDVLNVISEIIEKHETFSNLTIKEYLRERGFYATQVDVSNIMIEIRNTEELESDITYELSPRGYFIYTVRDDSVKLTKSIINSTVNQSTSTNTLLKLEVLDFFNRKIEEGDYIVYPIRCRSFMHLSHGIVNEINNVVRVLKVRGFKKNLDNSIKVYHTNVSVLDRVTIVYKKSEEGTKFTFDKGMYETRST